MGDLTAINDVINGGWSGWVSNTADKVVTAYLPKGATPAQSVTQTSASVVAAAPVAGKTIAGIPVMTLVIVGGVVLAAVFLLKK